MVTEPSTLLSRTPFVARALDIADDRLVDTPHGGLSLREIAAAAGGTHPAILKQFDSQVGFLAALATRQWERATAALDATDGTPLALAMADIAFAIDHPHRFGLMYDQVLWQCRVGGESLRPRESRELAALEAARDANFFRFVAGMGGNANDPRIRLVTALLTGLSLEFVNERLFADDRCAQLAHARDLVELALRAGSPEGW